MIVLRNIGWFLYVDDSFFFFLNTSILDGSLILSDRSAEYWLRLVFYFAFLQFLFPTITNLFSLSFPLDLLLLYSKF